MSPASSSTGCRRHDDPIEGNSERISERGIFSLFFRWISIFDALIFTIVSRGRNLTNDYMSEQLRLVNSQLCPILTEASWSIGNNDRSHGFIHRVLHKVQSNSAINFSSEVEICLAVAEMAWNFEQHTRSTSPHYNRFGDMPRQLGETEHCSSVRSHIALMELAREHTDQARAEHVILRALNRKYRHVTDLRLLRINDKVWFHRNKFGWRFGEVVKVLRPTIHVEHNNKIHPTHENGVRPFFGTQSQPPELSSDSADSHGIIDKPTAVQDIENDVCTDDQREEQQISRRPTAISDLVNGAFIVMNPIKHGSNSLMLTDDKLILTNVGKSPRRIIDSTVIYHTKVEHVKRIDTLNEEKQSKFKEALREV